MRDLPYVLKLLQLHKNYKELKTRLKDTLVLKNCTARTRIRLQHREARDLWPHDRPPDDSGFLDHRRTRPRRRP